MFTSIEIGKEVVKEDESYLYKLIWNSTNEHYTFPTYRIISGKQYYGITKILDKPHGLKKSMIDIITLLIKKECYRWQTIAKQYDEAVVLELIPLLVQAGIILVKEKNVKPAKGENWVKMEVALDPRAMEEARALFETQETLAQWRIKLNKEVNALLFPLNTYQSSITSKLEGGIKDGLAKLNNPTVKNTFPAQLTSRRKFRSILLMLVYARELVEKGETMPLRTLSSIIWDDTKVLDKYYKDVVTYIGEQLLTIGITTHPQQIWLYGGGEYEFDGEVTSLRGAKPVILTGETIMQAAFKPGTQLRNIVIVENETAFTTIIERTYSNRRDTLILWSHGYWSGYHKRIVEEILKDSNQKISIYIWCDLDIDGMMIAQNIYQWLNQFICTKQIVLMGAKELEMCQSKRALTERELGIIESGKLDGIFEEPLQIIKNTRVTIEQEKLLAYYKWVEMQLP